MKILVIDDDVIFCDIMKRVGERRGIQVTTLSALETMKRPDTWQFDAAVIDFNLDYVDGVELTQYIRHFGNDVPVWLVSQNSRESPQGWPNGIRGFMPKKLGPDAIFTQLMTKLNAS